MARPLKDALLLGIAIFALLVIWDAWRHPMNDPMIEDDGAQGR